MARKRLGHHDEGGHGNSERWLLTYADMITLLTAFFIMMYSMSVLNLEKFNKVAISIRSGFGGELNSAGHSVMNPSGANSIKPSILTNMEAFEPTEVYRQIKAYVRKHHLEKQLHLSQTARGVQLSIATDKQGRMFFPAGQADLTPETARLLSKIASVIARTDSMVRVEGHTDSLPIRTARYPSNWELSTARATTIVRYLIEKAGFDPARLSASGYADSRPLAPNDTEEHRSLNRRVDIFIDGEEREPEVDPQDHARIAEPPPAQQRRAPVALEAPRRPAREVAARGAPIEVRELPPDS